MMYDSKMALAVKSNGRVLRESKSGENTTVYLPFGCEYSLLLKNLNSVKALVKVWIDGTDVTHGTSGLIVEPNSSLNLERFIKNGNLSAGNRFRFIERSDAVSQHRGNKIDDGLIRVEFEYALRSPAAIWPTLTTYTGGDSMTDHTYYSKGGSWIGASGASGSSGISGSLRSKSISSGNEIVNYASTSQNANDVGVTVAGSVSKQEFTWGQAFITDSVKHVMVMQMLGEVEGQEVVKPVTVNHKPTCTSCGKVNKASAKFCSECGTGLVLVETTA